MVKQARKAISKFEEAVLNTALLRSKNPEDHLLYHDDVYNFTTGIHFGYDANRKAVQEYLHYSHAVGQDGLLLQGKENHDTYAPLMAFIPDLDDPKYRKNDVFDRPLMLKRIIEIDMASRITGMIEGSHDGAIIWGPKHINMDYVIAGQLRTRARLNANEKTGRDAETIQEAVELLMDPSDYIQMQRELRQRCGSKTLQGMEIALGIEDAAAHICKQTALKYGIGPTILATNYGMRRKSFLDKVPGLSEDQYFSRKHMLAVMQVVYDFQKEERKMRNKTWISGHIAPRKAVPVSPEELGIEPLDWTEVTYSIARN